MVRAATFVAGLSVMAIGLTAWRAEAAVTYQYVGNPYTSDILAGPGGSQSLPPDGEFLTASITFDGLTTTDFTGTLTVDDEFLQPPRGAPVSAWHVGDILSDGALLASFTFLDGDIVSWNVFAAYPFGPGLFAATTDDAGGTTDYTGTDYEMKSNQGIPGRWTELAAVPTPGSLLVLASGLLGLFSVTGFRRRLALIQK